MIGEVLIERFVCYQCESRELREIARKHIYQRMHDMKIVLGLKNIIFSQDIHENFRFYIHILASQAHHISCIYAKQH